MGYVSNLEINSLIQCASVVVNPSLYEAGNGPGLDACAMGVPIAMSNIPAFTEHLEVLGIKARLFDPRNPEDIAHGISMILDDPDSARKDAETSLRALEGRTWAETGAAYARIFADLVKRA